MSFEGHLLHHSMAPVAPIPLVMRQATLTAHSRAPILQQTQASTAYATRLSREAQRMAASSAPDASSSTALVSRTSAAKRQVVSIPLSSETWGLSDISCH